MVPPQNAENENMVKCGVIRLSRTIRSADPDESGTEEYIIGLLLHAKFGSDR